MRTKHGELTLEQIAELLPTTGEIMRSVGDCWWRSAYAARAGRWPLAAYYARRVRGLQRSLAVLRPKHRERVERFEREILAAVLAACAQADGPAYERAFTAGTDLANAMHVETGHGYITWVLPPDPPPDLDLSS